MFLKKRNISKTMLVNLLKVLGFGKTPPPCWEKFPKEIVFFFESVPYFLFCLPVTPPRPIQTTATTHFICIISSNPQGLNCADIKLRAMISTYFLRTLQPVSIHPFIQNIHGRLTLRELAQLLIIIHEAAPVINLK